MFINYGRSPYLSVLVFNIDLFIADATLEDAVSILAGREFALMRTAAGKVRTIDISLWADSIVKT